MIQSTLDILYLSLAIGFIVLVVFLSITLTYATFVLRDLSRVMHDVEEITDKVNEYILSPMRIANAIFENLKPFIAAFREKSGKIIRSRKHPEEQE